MKKILTIIPMAGKPTNSINASYNNLPDGMIPINSKPVVGHILDNLIERGLKDVLLLINKNDIYTEKYILLIYNKKLNIKFHYVLNEQNGILGSIYEGFNFIKKENYGSVFIYLGDTIYKGKLNFKTDFLTVSSNYSNPSLWCFFDEGKFINKPKIYNGNGKILTGLYFLKDIEFFSKCLLNNTSGEIHYLLENYQKKNKFKLINSIGRYDIGNIENYYKAKIDFLKVRGFNSIIYDETYGTIKKSSLNKEKIKQEINWYINIPYELKIFSPRLITYDLGKTPKYEIEYYGYQSLGDLYLFGYLNERVWFNIIDKLLGTINLFKKYSNNKPYSHFHNMYYIKTIDRINQIKKNKYFNNLYKKDILIINKKIYKNIKYFLKDLEIYIQYLYNKRDISCIHGDFCLSNILYDISNRIVKMIDPRGFFGDVGVYGDIKYDIAKLRHSFLGNYDFIVSDLFEVSENNNIFTLNIYKEILHNKIGKYFDKKLKENGRNINNIKFIEALLFLTMIPLHEDNFERQKAMYLIAVQTFNSINYKGIGK